MKFTITILLLINSMLSFSAAYEEKLFDCAHLNETSIVDRIVISKFILGKNHYYELEVKLMIQGMERSYSKRVNLISKYDGRVLHFTNGNHRLKIDRTFPREGKYPAFGRVPEYNIHSFNWVCKDWN
jgi:hypothetical protein